MSCRRRAWDEVHESLRGYTCYGNQREPTEGEQRMRDVLDELGQTTMPVEAIGLIPELVRAVEKCVMEAT